nr:MAG TPA: hypothetical protein [Crassvirales sp.]
MTSMIEYFGKWLRVIDIDSMYKALSSLDKSQIEFLCPKYPDIFRAFKLCPYEDLKVVMIGQDPYPQKGVATGILFGNRKETTEEDLSPSLQIIKEAAIDYEIPHSGVIFDHTLESWAEQGILMINSALTTKVGVTGLHSMIWRPFMSSLLKNLSEWNPGLIYVLFGEQAKALRPYINKYTNIVLEEKHPAYYARIGKKMPSTIFKVLKELTRSKYGEDIKFYTEYET